MDMLKLLRMSAIAAALSASAGALAAHEGGDIYDIVPCDSEGNWLTNSAGQAVTWATWDAPITNAGQSVYFKIRLARLSPLPGQGLWKLVHKGSNDELVDDALFPLRIGVFARGQDQNDYATLVNIDNEDGNYTQLVFEYVTKGGDFAMPLVLKGENGQPAVSYKDSDSILSRNGFWFSNTNKWEIVNEGDGSGSYEGDAPNFWAWTYRAGWPAPSDMPATDAAGQTVERSRDMTLQSAGIYVKTIDFGKKWEISEEKAAADGTTAVWRTVHEGDTATIGDTPILEKLMAYSNDTVATLYIWSDDDSAVTVTNGSVLTTITNRFTGGVAETKQVWMKKITVSGSAPTTAFTLYGASQTGGKNGDGTCNLVLSPYPGYVFIGGNVTGTLNAEPLKSYTTVPVKCGPPLPATLIVEHENGSRDFTMTAGVGEDYKNAKAVLQVRLTQAYAEDMTVTITNAFTETGYDGDWTDYVAYSTTGAYPTGADTAAPTVTIPAGQLTASEKIYVFAKKTDTHVAMDGQIAFHAATADAAAQAFLKNYTASFASINADAPAIKETQADESEGVVSGTCNVPFEFKVKVEDVYAAQRDRTTGFKVQWKKVNSDAVWTTLEGRYYIGAEGWLYRLAEATNESGVVTYYYDEDATAVPPKLTYPTANTAGYTSKLQIVSPVKNGTADRTASVEFTAIIGDPKSATMRVYDPAAPELDVNVVNEDNKKQYRVKVALSEANGTSHKLYAYLQPRNNFDTDKLRTLTPYIVGQTNNFYNAEPATANLLKGLLIDAGQTESETASIWFIDGTEEGQNFQFRVVILDEPEWDGIDESKIRGDYGSSSYTVTAMNVEPTVAGMEINGDDSTGNGEKYATKLPVGIARKFAAIVNDPGKYDLTATNGNENATDVTRAGDLFRVRWRIYLDDQLYEDPRLIYGNPESHPLEFPFPEAGLWRIECQIRDKDMDGWASSSYSVYVEVLDQPVVNLNNHLYGGGIPTLYEDQIAATNITVSLDYFDSRFRGEIYVALKVKSNAPADNKNPGRLKLSPAYVWDDTTGPDDGTGFAFGPFDIDEKSFERKTADAGADYYIIRFNKNTTKRTLAITELDGTDNTFSLTAYVAWSSETNTATGDTVVDGELPTNHSKPVEYYIADTIEGVFVENAEPTVSMPAQNNESNAWKVAGGRVTNRSINWRVIQDIDNDFTNYWANGIDKGVLVAISGTANPTNIYVTGKNTSGTYIPDFGETTGDQMVTVTISDKDSRAPQTFTYYYFVAPSKFLYLYATGPGSGPATELGKKYKDLMRANNSYGAGHVWADTNRATWASTSWFKHTWNCSENPSVTISAYGYKVANPLDNGKLDNGRDIGIDANGNRSANDTINDTNCYNYTNDYPEAALDADGKASGNLRDSFFYCWIQHDPAATDAAGAGVLLRGIVSPEYAGDRNAGTMSITLPETEEEAEQYEATEAEAIFTLERYWQDNVGDINGDGIPDIIAQMTWSGNPTLIEMAGGDKYENDGLKLGDLNPAEDFLPALVGQTGYGDATRYHTGSGNNYAPGTLPFTTRLHVRGFHKGLNYYRQYGVTSEPDFGEDELTAYANWVARTGNAADPNVPDLSVWSPEPTGELARMDPTRKSGDGDQFPDGWEYFFWYQAKVWWECWDAYNKTMTGWTDEQKQRAQEWNDTMASWGDEADWDDEKKQQAQEWNDTMASWGAVDGWGDEDGWTPEQKNQAKEWRKCLGRPRSGQRYLFERFNIDNITEGDAIPPEDVLARFNPCVELSAGALANDPDFDNDGLSDLEELALGTNPCHWDTDGDKMNDKWEVMHGLNALAANAGGNPDGDWMAMFAVQGGEDAMQIYAMKADGTWATEEDYDIYADEGQTLYAVIGLLEEDAFDEESGTLTQDAKAKCFAFKPKFKNGMLWLYGTNRRDTQATAADSPSGHWGGPMVTVDDSFEQQPIAAGARAYKADNARPFILVHDQVKKALGYDPRTAWCVTSSGFVGERWNPAINSAAQGGQGVPVNTEPYTNFDEYLLLEYVREFKFGEDGYRYTTRFDTEAETMNDIFARATTNPNVVLRTEDSSSGGDDEEDSSSSTTTSTDDMETDDAGNALTATVLRHGADSDNDGIPDGWELYVDRNPRLSPADDGGEHLATSADGDQLNLVAEYAGTDSCNAYTNRFDGSGNIIYYECDSITKNHPRNSGPVSGWFNKFFPTDPDDFDTDGDGIKDGMEGATWYEMFYNDGLYYANRQFTFIYGSNTDNYTTLCFRGGGMNPCTVDTDADGLPDGWEMQHAGLVSDASSPRSELSEATLVADGLYAKLNSTNETAAADGESSSGALYIAGGMDATWPGDVQTDIGNGGNEDDRTGTRRDVDFDRDGLENWQEYMVQAVRHFRYDDISTPLMGRILSEGAYDDNHALVGTHTQEFLGFAQFSMASGQELAQSAAAAWAQDGVEAVEEYIVTTGVRRVEVPDGAGNTKIEEIPVTATRKRVITGAVPQVDAALEAQGEFRRAWTTDGWRQLGYLATPPKAFDRVLLGAGAGVTPPFYMMPVTAINGVQGAMRINNADHGFVAGYASCDPRMADTDGDGMDDYYEMFHGLNPILGCTPNFDAEEPDETLPAHTSAWQDTSYGKHGDIIALAYSTGSEAGNTLPYYNAYYNEWIYPTFDRGAAFGGQAQKETKQLRPPAAYDPVLYPWTAGSPLADPDGDGIRNDEERALANIADPLPTHTDPTPLWFTERTSKSSFTWQYYSAGQAADSLVSTYFGGEGFLFGFEETEGYDTDNDFTPDSFEVVKTATPYSDPLKFTDPARRQAFYLPGNNGYAVTYETAVRPDGPADLLRQFTVELWVRPSPEKMDVAQTIIERSCIYEGDAITKDAKAIRANFRIGLTADGVIYGMFDNADAKESGADEPTSCQKIDGGKIEPDKWSHVALTFDGTTLAIYIDGALRASTRTALVPANGLIMVVQNPVSPSAFPTAPGDYFGATESALFIGARPKAARDGGDKAMHPYYPFTQDAMEVADQMKHEESFDNVREFFQGYVDEVRVWDGAKTGAEILAGMNKAMSFADVAQNREDVYVVWKGGGTRNNNDANATLPPELIYHYSFVDIPGAVEPEDVARKPTGFDDNVALAAENDYISNPDISTDGFYANLAQLKGGDDDYGVSGSLKVGWWENCRLKSTVYQDTRIVPWIQNTVQHLPLLDGSAVDTFIYGDYYAGGYTPASLHGIARYVFPNSAMPYGNGNIGAGMSVRRFRAARLVAQRGSDHSDHAERSRYDERSWFDGSSDLIPLGGAFAKRCEEMWDGAGPASPWESAGGEDANVDGIPDWYEEYARNNLVPDMDPAASLEWNMLVPYPDKNSDVRVPAGVAYMIDLNRGMLPDGEIHDEYANKADLNNNNIYDWWEQLFALEDCNPDDDYDNDGLTNFAEFILSFGETPYGIENGFPYLDPTQPRTGVEQKTTDYFLPEPGGRYMGEIATDHDFMENWWEIGYSVGYTNARIYDPDLDTDGDGWDNFSENRAFTWFGGYVSEIIDRYLDGNDDNHEDSHPMPAVGIRPTYYGQQDVNGATLVMRVKSGYTPRTDATFVAYGTRDIAGAEGGFEVTQMMGIYFGDTIIHGAMHLGHIIPGSMHKFEMRRSDAEPVYYWHCDTASGHTGLGGIRLGADETGSDWMGTEADYLSHRRAHGVQYVTLTQTVLEYDPLASTQSTGDGTAGNIVFTGNDIYAGQVIGKIDFLTGEYEIDLGKVSSFGVELDNMVFRERHYYRIGDEWPQTLWMSSPSSGFLRQGPATVEAFFDLDGSGTWTAGEPYGIVKDVNIGWHRKSVLDVELKETGNIIPRYSIADGKIDTKEILGSASLVTVPSGDDGEEAQDGDGENESAGLTRTINIKRSEINGQPGRERTIATGKLLTDDRAYMTEADVIEPSLGIYDLDWLYLRNDADALFGTEEAITSAKYEVSEIFELADGSVTNRVRYTFVKSFTEKRPLAYPVAPVRNRQVYSCSPVLEFEAANDAATAFAVEIADESGTVIYESGAQPIYGRTSATIGKKSVYRFTPDIYVDAQIGGKDGPVFEDGKTYSWRVALMNAAHPEKTLTEDDWSDWADFDLDVSNANVDKNPQIPTGYGMVGAAVRYYGSNPDAFVENNIIVEAHATADFASRPLAQVRIDNLTQLDDINDTTTANALMRGIAPQTVWLVAWVDSNGNNTRDAWETWGYANMTGTTRFDIYTPAGVEVTESMQNYNIATIYLEDTDLNRNEDLDYNEPNEDFESDAAATGDPDGDGLPSDDEGKYGLDAGTWDTDGDGMPDGWEVWIDGRTDPQTPDGNLVSDDAEDVMAYAEIPAALITVENAGGETAVWALPAVLDWKTTGAQPVLGETPQVGDEFTFTQAKDAGFLETYRYGSIYGVGRAPSYGTWRVTNVDAGASVALVHAQVYHYFGFSPRTCVAGADAVNTKPMTALDKYLVVRYLDALGLADEDTVNRNRLWEVWTLVPGEKDIDFDGIPDGWELYTMFKDSTLTRTADSPNPWNYYDREAKYDGLRLLDEWDRGDWPTDPWKADTDGDGITDAIAFNYHIKGERMLDDDDGDGLSNYAEYLLSERFKLGTFDPDRAYSANEYEPDYFYKAGSLYVGEIFTDYDQIDDAWEDEAGTAIANRYTWDAKRDGDENGWSAYDEAMAAGDTNTWTVVGTQTNIVETIDETTGATTNMTVEIPVYGYAGRPAPILTLKLRYNGTRRLVGGTATETTASSSTSTATNETATATTPIVAETFTDVNNPDETKRLVAHDAKFSTDAEGDLQLQPLTVSMQEPVDGFAKGGRNMIFAFCDLDGDGEFTPGEPAGTAFAQIGWRGGYAEIELTDTSVVTTRLKIGGEVEESSETTQYLDDGAEDGTQPEGQIIPESPVPSTDRKVVWGDAHGDYSALWAGSDTGGEYEQVRIVRSLVNGETIAGYDFITNQVVLDKILTIGQKPYISEGDIFARGDFDLDWGTLRSNVVAPFRRNGIEVTNMTYRIVLGNGSIAIDETNNLFSVAITRYFDAQRMRPVEIAPGARDAAVFASHPTFKWSMEGHDTYTAFRLQITAANNDRTVVWDSGLRLAPPRDGEGNYVFEADAFAGCELERGRGYSWRVAMYNAKFSNDEESAYSAEAGTFLMATPETGGIYGSVGVSVKYFGPPDALAASTVKVEAYASPDFTGMPLARGKVAAADLAGVASYTASNTVNATLAGIERGTRCYIRAWLDMNAYGGTNRVDAFEAWGAACGRNRNPSDPYRPQAFEIGYADGSQRMAEVFVEDVDSNGNRLPDTWEMAVNNGELYATAEQLDAIVAGGHPVNASLAGSLVVSETSAADLSSPLATLVASTLGTRAGAALALGVSPSKLALRETASGALEIAVESRVEGVKVESIGFDADGNLALDVAADTAEAALAGGLFPSATITVAPAQVVVKVYRKATLAEEGWTCIVEQSATIDGGSQTRIVMPESAGAGGSGFFKVVVEE